MLPLLGCSRMHFQADRKSWEGSWILVTVMMEQAPQPARDKWICKAHARQLLARWTAHSGERQLGRRGFVKQYHILAQASFSLGLSHQGCEATYLQAIWTPTFSHSLLCGHHILLAPFAAF